MPTRGRSNVDRRNSSTKHEGLQIIIKNVKHRMHQVEKTIDTKVVDKYLSEKNISQVKENARIYAKSLGDAIGQVDEELDLHLCPAQMSVAALTDGGKQSNIYGNKSTKKNMMEKNNARRSEIRNTINQGRTPPKKTTAANNVSPRNTQHRTSQPQRTPRDAAHYEVENLRLKEELKSASISFAKLEANKIKLNEKHNKTLKSVLTEMVKAEKKFKKERALFDDGKRSLMKKLKIKQERIENIEKYISSKDSESKSRDEEILSLRVVVNDVKNESSREREMHGKQTLELKKTVVDQKVIITGLTDEASRLKSKLIELKSSSSSLIDDTLEERRLKDGAVLKEKQRMAEELENKDSTIRMLEQLTVRKDKELEGYMNEVTRLRSKTQASKSSLNEHISTKEQMLLLKELNEEQRDMIKTLTSEVKTLREHVNELKTENEALTANEPSINSERSSATTKHLINTLMREIYSLSVENGALHKELKNYQLNDTMDTPSSLEIDDLRSLPPNPPASVLADVEREISKLKENIIVAMDRERGESLDESILTETEIHNMSFQSTIASAEDSIRTKDKNQMRPESFDEFSDVSFGGVSSSLGGVSSAKTDEEEEEDDDSYYAGKDELFSVHNGDANAGWVSF